MPVALAIVGTHSGVGKTSVSLGLMGALRRRGLTVQPFKVGPDFIDPGHHSLVTGRVSHNLDGWMLSKKTNLDLFQKYARDCDVAIVEGVMGVYDGYGATSEAGSTAQIVKWLGIPAILVIDAGKMGRSAAALVSGYANFDPDLPILGVVCNRIGSSSHLERLRESIESATSLPVFGGIPKNCFPEIPSRHLGLWMAKEDNLGTEYLEKLASSIEQYLEIDRLLEQCPTLDLETRSNARQDERLFATTARQPKIAIARDEAFCFYYEENLQILRELGATLVEVSPLCDRFPDDIDGFYFGGGYPELHAEGLSQNREFIKNLIKFSKSKFPVYGECGGLIYLSRGILDRAGDRHPFVGIFPFWTKLGERAKLGYTEIEICENAPFVPYSLRARGHRFHYSEIVKSDIAEKPSLETCYTAKSWKSGIFKEGYRVGNTLVSYVHLHFASNPEFARFFVESCQQQK